MDIQKIQLIEDFNRHIKRIITYVMSISKNKIDQSKMYEMRDKVYAVIDATPNIVMEIIGPQLFKKRDMIYRGTVSELIDINTLKPAYDDIDIKKDDKLFDEMMQMIRLVHNIMTHDDEISVLTGIQNLLDIYLKYILIIKQNK